MNEMIIIAKIASNYYPDFPGYERRWVDGNEPMYYPIDEPYYEPCDVCDGNGTFFSDLLDDVFDCPACHGRGNLLIEPVPENTEPLTLEQAREKFRNDLQAQRLIAVYGHPRPVSISDYWDRATKRKEG